MNVLDKFVISHKVKSPLSYCFIAGMVNLMIGGLLALFLSWSGITIKSLLFPAIAGILIGSQFFPYYLVLKKEDVSHLVGFIYIYPAIVAVLSFLFLNEILSVTSYIGMFLILLGILMLSIRMKQIRLRASVWMIVMMILVIALYEFFIKIATIDLPVLNGISISSIFIGITMLPILLHKKSKNNIVFELKNAGWALLNETLTFLGILTVYFAMAGLPATVVSSLAATQPLTVLFIEKIFHRSGIKICRDPKLLHKLIPISLIVLGIVLLYAPEMINRLK